MKSSLFGFLPSRLEAPHVISIHPLCICVMARSAREWAELQVGGFGTTGGSGRIKSVLPSWARLYLDPLGP